MAIAENNTIMGVLAELANFPPDLHMCCRFVATDRPAIFESNGQQWVQTVGAADVYVDGARGDDANPGTQARPVATIRRAAELWPMLRA